MDVEEWIKTKADGSLDPGQVATTLSRLDSCWPPNGASLQESIETFPLGEAALFHLFAMSSICATRIVQNPDLLLWLCRPEISSQPRDQIAMAEELQRISDGNVAAN